jgi:hypothetical protein
MEGNYPPSFLSSVTIEFTGDVWQLVVAPDPCGEPLSASITCGVSLAVNWDMSGLLARSNELCEATGSAAAHWLAPKLSLEFIVLFSGASSLVV